MNERKKGRRGKGNEERKKKRDEEIGKEGEEKKQRDSHRVHETSTSPT